MSTTKFMVQDLWVQRAGSHDRLYAHANRYDIAPVVRGELVRMMVAAKARRVHRSRLDLFALDASHVETLCSVSSELVRLTGSKLVATFATTTEPSADRRALATKLARSGWQRR